MNAKHVLGQSFELFITRYNGPRNAHACVRAFLNSLTYQGQFEIKAYAHKHWEELVNLFDSHQAVIQNATEIFYTQDYQAPQLDL